MMVDLPDDEMVDTAVVLIKTVDVDGKVGFRMKWPDRQSWLERYGMLAAAAEIENYDTLTTNNE